MMGWMENIWLWELQSNMKVGGIAFRVLLNAAALFAAAWLLPGVSIKKFVHALMAALLLAVFNSSVGGLLDFLSLPITVLTLGLFSWVVDGLILWLVSKLLEGFTIQSFFWAFILAAVLSLFNVVLHGIYL